MDWVRTPAVAGLFYPEGGAALRAEVERLLEEARLGAPGGAEAPEGGSSLPTNPKALIAPHAGYVYSGPVAASGYRFLIPLRERVRRVVLLGPAHRHPFRGLAASSASSFATPLGKVPVDPEGLALALELPQVRLLDAAHEGEHSLEVHLPFLQVVLGSFRVIPLVVGEARPEEVAAVLEALWGGEETFVVVSSDLSHYLSYDQAAELDRTTSRSIEDCRPEEIGFHQACGRIPVAGLLLRAREEGLGVRCLDLRSSGDTAGSRGQVVGYGAFLVG